MAAKIPYVMIGINFDIAVAKNAITVVAEVVSMALLALLYEQEIVFKRSSFRYGIYLA